MNVGHVARTWGCVAVMRAWDRLHSAAAVTSLACSAHPALFSCARGSGFGGKDGGWDKVGDSCPSMYLSFGKSGVLV